MKARVDAELAREALERRPLGPVADDVVRHSGRQRAQHVGVALARDEVAERDDRAAARATVVRHFTWARCGQETLAAYADALR